MINKCFLVFLVVLWQSVNVANQCVTRGRFPNRMENCRGYTMCINGPNGFIEYNLTCPESFIFSHLENLCTNVTSYKCMPEFNCREVGNFETDSANCTSFMACVEGINGLVDARWSECPQGTVFSPTDKNCINETLYSCHNIHDSPNILSILVNNEPIFTANFTLNVSPTLRYQYTTVYGFSLLMLFYTIQK